MRGVTRAIALSLPTTPPTEFRIFRAGRNETTKGTFNFDAAAAKSVMTAFQRWGVDLIVDLNHDSVSDSAARPDSSDARGWFKLSVRNGELWAVDVRWTPDGERRLREKTQRYISPYFSLDESGRITEVINAALVSMPATHGAPALVAASKRTAVVAARVPVEVRAKLYRTAARRGTTPNAMIASVLATLTSGGVPPTLEAAQALFDLLQALGLDENTPSAQIMRAIAALLATPAAELRPAASGDQGADPLQADAEAQPKPLSAATRKQIANNGMTDAEFLRRKAVVSAQIKGLATSAKLSAFDQLTAAERSKLAALGITTDAQFTAHKKKQIRRV